MRSKWVVLGLALAISAGCSGRAVTDGVAGAAGAAGEMSLPGAGQPSTTYPPSAGQAGAPSTTCLATLEEVNALGGSPCPRLLCNANAWASDCTSLPKEITYTYQTECDGIQRITLEQSGTVSKVCYYKRSDFGQPELFAARVIGDENSRCVTASGNVETVLVPPECPDDGAMPLCDRTSHHVPQPAKTCFNRFSSSCEICCPAQQPDCTTEPDGYPGYLCTSLDNAFCSCACAAGQWNCGC